MICIDFLAGSHGNFLEFICNKFIANIPTVTDHPFNTAGASHKKQYLDEPKFQCDHYSVYNKPLMNCAVISVQITPMDLLPLQSVSLFRATDLSIDPDTLELDTYHKLNNKDYRWMLDNILSSFFNNQVVHGYAAVADSTWPKIKNINDYNNLPTHIKQECEQVHGLTVLRLDQYNPNCPRFVLREFFKIGFKQPELNGLMQQQASMKYDASSDVYYFPFHAFYVPKLFVAEIESISKWMEVDSIDTDKISQLHAQFLQRQPYAQSRQKCETILKHIIEHTNVELTGLTVLDEAYVDAQLELVYNKTVPENKQHWFKNTKQIIEFINEC
jgi:hypothetical protein